MKALTISQPYASLIANGEKWVENRTWPTSYRGPLLIHAGKGQQYMTLRQMQAAGMPSGKIVAVADLVGCIDKIEISMFAAGPDGTVPYRDLGGRTYRDLWRHPHTEGPVCWILANVVKFDEPVPCRGAQGLWVPEGDILTKAREAIAKAKNKR